MGIFSTFLTLTGEHIQLKAGDDYCGFYSIGDSIEELQMQDGIYLDGYNKEDAEYAIIIKNQKYISYIKAKELFNIMDVSVKHDNFTLLNKGGENI